MRHVDAEMTAKRMAELERRVLALEERTRRDLKWEEERLRRMRDLSGRYGEYVDKTVAAKILGVTRTTVYAMLADGRIEGACEGRRVSVNSIVQYLMRPKLGEGGRSRRGRRSAAEAAQSGIDTMRKGDDSHECA